MTVAAVSGLFVISWLPSILVIFLGVAGISSTDLIWLDKLQINFYFLSVFGNPVLYSLVHKGFGNFARSKFSIILRRCQNSVEAQWQNSVSKSSEHTPGPAESAATRRGSRKDIRRAASCENMVNEPGGGCVPAGGVPEKQPVPMRGEDRSEDNSKDSGLCSAT